MPASAERSPSPDYWQRFCHEHLLERGARQPPSRITGTASAFSDWVMGLYRRRRGVRTRMPWSAPVSLDDQRMILGRMEERFIEEERLWYRSTIDGESHLDLLFADPLDGTAPAFAASRLKVAGSPLLCVPDVVLRDARSGSIVIKERKVGWVSEEWIPREGWPNLKAQLWCYAWIDDWVDAPRVTLVGEIWHHRFTGMNVRTSIRPVWERSEEQFHRECLELFNCYGGTYEETGL